MWPVVCPRCTNIARDTVLIRRTGEFEERDGKSRGILRLFMDLLRDKCDEVSKYLYRKEGRERKLAVLNVYYGKNFPPSSHFKMRNGNIRKYIREIISFVVIRRICGKFLKMERNC